MADDEARGPRCETCYKALPENFQGFDICPRCLFLSRQRASAYRSRPPRYQSPLLALQEPYNADENE